MSTREQASSAKDGIETHLLAIQEVESVTVSGDGDDHYVLVTLSAETEGMIPSSHAGVRIVTVVAETD